MSNKGLIVGLSCLLMQACTTDFQAFVNTDPIPVVYGMINPADSLYSIRLTKTFVGPGSATQYASIPDSLYYENAEVWLETRGQNGELIERAQLYQTQIENRDPGLFATGDNRVYQTDRTQLHLDPDFFTRQGIPYDITLHLFVRIPGVESLLHAYSPLQVPPRITQPRYAFLTKIYLFSEETFFMEWIHDYPNDLYEIEVTFHYRDIYEDFEVDTLTSWILKGIQHNTTTFPGGIRSVNSYYFRPENFYAQIAASIPDNPSVEVRIAGTFDFVVLSSDEHIRLYQEVNRIADDYRGASYSNIENGLGIFSTYTTIGFYGVKMGPQEIDSLANGRYTRHLNFSRWY